MFEYDRKYIRNFSIIAHIDHGKSTLADRLLGTDPYRRSAGHAGAVSRRYGPRAGAGHHHQSPPCDDALSGRRWHTYQINLIDTPGHVDFAYEVSRSLSACEGALLVVDAVQGVQAQTLANVHLAIDRNLEIVPVINKIDLPAADPEGVKKQIEEVIGLDASNAILISAKTGIGIEAVLERIFIDIPRSQRASKTTSSARWSSTPITILIAA